MPDLRIPTHPDWLVGKLTEASRPSAQPVPVAMTALATAVTLLGAPGVIRECALHALPDYEDPVGLTIECWAAMILSFPYLGRASDPLLGWLGNPTEGDVAAYRACYRVLSGVDILGTVQEHWADGDLLGPIYVGMLSSAKKRRDGIFYTPMNVSRMIAEMNAPHEGASICDPCCGCGGMLIAAVRVMRDRGLRPETCLWVANDIDPLAAALCAVNLAIRGLPNVRVTAMDALRDEFLNPEASDDVSTEKKEKSA